MRNNNILACLAAMLIGVACIAVDVWSNLEFVAGRALTPRALADLEIWSSLAAAVVVVAIATAGALAAAGAAFRSRRYGLASGLFVAFMCGAVFSLSATYDRVAASASERRHEKASHNVTLDRQETALAAERAALEHAEAGSARECAGAPADRRGWPLCATHEGRAQSARDEIRRLSASLIALGAEKETDGATAQAAAMALGVRPHQVALVQSAMLPWALFLFGSLLTAFGLAGLAQPRVAPLRVIDVTPEMVATEMPEPVVAALRQFGRPMSNRELAKAIGKSEATAMRRVEDLVRKGIVSKTDAGRAKAIALVQ